MLRKQIRDELSPGTKENQFLRFFNSPMGLLLISGIIIGGAGKLITKEINNIRSRNEVKKEGIRYLTELDERIFQLDFFLKKIDTSKADSAKRYYSTGAGGSSWDRRVGIIQSSLTSRRYQYEH